MAISQFELIRRAPAYQEVLQESMEKMASLNRTKSAFLCHSHKDETLVKGLIAMFQNARIDLYVDWKDHSMPTTPNALTAKKIQKAIRGCGVFLFLATANARVSRWCPWEIGFADSSQRKVFIVPTRDFTETYGNEYLQLYPRIDIGTHKTNSGLALFDVGMRKGKWLSSASL